MLISVQIRRKGNYYHAARPASPLSGVGIGSKGDGGVIPPPVVETGGKEGLSLPLVSKLG